MDWKKVAGVMFYNQDLSYINPSNNTDQIGNLKPSTSTFLSGQTGTVTVSTNIIDGTKNVASGNQDVVEGSLVDSTNTLGILQRFMGNVFTYVPSFLGGFSGAVTATNILESPKVDIWTTPLEYSGLDI